MAGHPGMAFMAGYFGGHVDKNASPVELGSYVAGDMYRDRRDH